MPNGRRPKLSTGGSLWGPRRVAAGITLDQLADASGVHKALLSLMENGRMIPRGDEHERVMDALARLTGSAA
jgi:transcriptional regulator with XRE-family HTH domain